MQGSVNDAMAEAVENAEVVLFGVSNAYKESGAKNAFFCAIVVLKMITLPRQARNKHRENSKRDAFFAANCRLEANYANQQAKPMIPLM